MVIAVEGVEANVLVSIPKMGQPDTTATYLSVQGSSTSPSLAKRGRGDISSTPIEGLLNGII